MDRTKKISAVVLLVIVAIVAVLLFSGKSTAKLEGNTLTISSTLSSSTTVAIEDIRDLTFTKEIDLGSRKFGVGIPKVKAGSFHNDLYGDYTLHANTDVKDYIVFQVDGKTICFNLDTIQKTSSFYQILVESLQ